MKWNIRRVGILLSILAVSIGFGFAFDAIATIIEKHSYPLEPTYADSIRANADAFGIPEPVLWAMVRTQSHFASNAVGTDGRIGLMQLTPTEFAMIQSDLLGEEPQNEGMLYDPQTNLRCGAAYLSELYRRYGIWETVYAAYAVGSETVDAWLKEPAYVSEQGTLKQIPNASAAAFVREVSKAQELYTKLYFEK